MSDLKRADIEGGGHFDVADVITAELDVHQPGNGILPIGVPVEVQPLNKRRGAVPYSDDRNANFFSLQGRPLSIWHSELGYDGSYRCPPEMYGIYSPQRKNVRVVPQWITGRDHNDLGPHCRLRDESTA